MDVDFPAKDFYNFNLYNVSENQFEPQGDLQAHIAIILPPFASSTEKDFLSKILQAVQIADLDTVLTLPLAPHARFSWANFVTQTQATHWLIFARTGVGIGWQFDPPLYQPFIWQNKHQFLFCESLAIIQNDVNKKRLLWEALKQLFQ